MIAVCPRCDRALVVLSWRDMDVDVCPGCRGVWLDQGELEELFERTGARMDDPLLEVLKAEGHRSASRRPHLCPRCDARLREVPVPCGDDPRPALHIDRCPRGHGLWFDSGELHALLESLPPHCLAGKTLLFLSEMLGFSGTTQSGKDHT